MLDLKDKIVVNNKKYLLSTVDLSAQFSTYPIIGSLEWPFETALFWINDQDEVDLSDLYCNRYKTIEEAEKGHKDFLRRVQNREKMPFLEQE